MSLFLLTVYITIFFIVVCFLAGLITRNYSHVDRLWSLLPPLYAIIWGIKFYAYPQYLIPAVLVILWGIRLTGNFARRGGYRFSFKNGFTAGFFYYRGAPNASVNGRVYCRQPAVQFLP